MILLRGNLSTISVHANEFGSSIQMFLPGLTKTQLYAKYKRLLKQRFRKAHTKGTEKGIQAKRTNKRRHCVQDIRKRRIQAEKH